MPSADHVVLAQVAFEDDSGLPRDRSINTFHVVDVVAPSDVPSSADLDQIRDQIIDFYTAAHTGSTAHLADFFSSTLSGVWSIKYYDLHDALPRSPLRIDTPSNVTPGATAMPQEVSLCISYQAAHLSGFDQRNRRGRIYFGPLAQTALGSTAARPNSNANQLMPTAVAAGHELVTAHLFTGNQRFVVFSQKFQTWAQITNGWVDNEFDTQRRRGYRPTVRTVFP